MGASGIQLAEPICKAFIDAVKSGDADKFNYELMTNQVEVRDVVDAHQYFQNLIFTACVSQNESKTLDMVKVLVSLGVDFL
jgi:hypothetical protein